MFLQLILCVSIGLCLANTVPEPMGVANEQRSVDSSIDEELLRMASAGQGEQTLIEEAVNIAEQRALDKQRKQQTLILVKPAPHRLKTTVPPSIFQCGPNQIISDCVTPCQPTCEFPHQLPCPEFDARSNPSTLLLIKGQPNKPPPPPCKAGCVCQHGYVRNEFGKCIAKSECPAMCKPHSHFEKCGPRCQSTCQVLEPRASTLKECIDQYVCVSGCFCDAGYVKDTQSGLCVKPQNCPTECPENEHYSDYGVPCAPNCQKQKVGHGDCNEKWEGKPGCYCNKGFLRDLKTMKCVRQYDCPPKECPANEMWYKCKPCTPSCRNLKPNCTKNCETGCDCKKGYVRDEKTRKCVKLCECTNYQVPTQ